MNPHNPEVQTRGWIYGRLCLRGWAMNPLQAKINECYVCEDVVCTSHKAGVFPLEGPIS